MAVTALLEYLNLLDCLEQVMKYIKGCGLPCLVFYSKTAARLQRSVVMACSGR